MVYEHVFRWQSIGIVGVESIQCLDSTPRYWQVGIFCCVEPVECIAVLSVVYGKVVIAECRIEVYCSIFYRYILIGAAFVMRCRCGLFQ